MKGVFRKRAKKFQLVDDVLHYKENNDAFSTDWPPLYTRPISPIWRLNCSAHCQMPEIYDDMVECEMCGDWYHLKCVSLEQFPAEAMELQKMCQVIVVL